MNPLLETLFSEPEKAYLRPDEITTMSQFVSSLPERINLYRSLRNEELSLMQPIANALTERFAQVPEVRLRRSVQNGILVLRYAAMAMLVGDASFVTKRLYPWLPEIAAAYGTHDIDLALYEMLKRSITERFTPLKAMLLMPGIETAQELLTSPVKGDDADAHTELTSETLVSLF